MTREIAIAMSCTMTMLVTNDDNDIDKGNDNAKCQ